VHFKQWPGLQFLVRFEFQFLDWHNFLDCNSSTYSNFHDLFSLSNVVATSDVAAGMQLPAELLLVQYVDLLA